MTGKEIVEQLEKLKNPKNVDGMAKFGIRPKTTILGISTCVLRTTAKDIKRQLNSKKKQHAHALRLWETKIHEARHLAVFIEDPKNITEKQMEKWIKDFDCWDICDQATTSLFDQTPLAYEKAFEWTNREKEFEKRAGFALMAGLAVHDKKADDSKFYPFLRAIEKEATDERNFVKKAACWALGSIGKSKNKNLHKHAVRCADKIKK